MPTVTTEGLILKRVNFGEADRVLTVLTDRYGKISTIARGVRKITSRRAGNIEVLNRVKLHLFKAKSYTLSEAESIDTFQRIKDSLTLSTYAFHILELIDRLVPEEQKNPNIYALVLETLELLKTSPRQIFIRSFEVKLLSLLGFWSTAALPNMKDETRDIMEKLQYVSWEEISEMRLNEEQAIDLERVLRYYIERILEGSLKSVQVMNKLRAGAQRKN
jgi:DNA repair protein RecO (recombination protein O)